MAVQHSFYLDRSCMVRVYTLTSSLSYNCSARNMARTIRNLESRQASHRCRRLFNAPQVLLRHLTFLHSTGHGDPSSLCHALSRAEHNSEEESKGKQGKCVGRDADPPGPRSSQHRASNSPSRNLPPPFLTAPHRHALISWCLMSFPLL